MDPDEILEIYLSDAGEYVGANDVARELLGYTDEELRGVPLGALSGADPEAARSTWAAFVAGKVQPLTDAPGQMEGRDGRTVTVRHLGTEARPGGGFVSRSVLDRRGPLTAPGVWNIATLLAESRTAERVMRSMAPDDPRLPAARARLNALRKRYRAVARESQRIPGTDGS